MAGATIHIPERCLVVLIGAAGAGKSTFARRWFSASEILSSDALRAEFGRGESDQRASRVAFALLHDRLAARLAADQLTVVDATNIRAAARQALLARRPLPTFPAVALILAPGEATVHAQNVARTERTVPVGVVKRQLAALRHVTDQGLRAEGFAEIQRIVDARRVAIVRA